MSGRILFDNFYCVLTPSLSIPPKMLSSVLCEITMVLCALSLVPTAVYIKNVPFFKQGMKN